MSAQAPKILVTGANGKLGRLVVEALLHKVPAGQIIATARKAANLADFAARGVEVREADYESPASLDAAFAGVDRALLISSSEVGQRLRQHGNVIEAARKAGVKLLAYTSILHADRSTLGLAVEHRGTEELLRASGVPFALLRNGWYLENYTMAVANAAAHGAHFGCADEGRIAPAARADFAEAAAAVLTSEQDQAGKVYELAGDESFTLAELAAEISRQAGKAVVYNNLPQADYAAMLVKVGLPQFVADLLSDSDAGAAKGGLFDDGHALSKLIGRPTSSVAGMVKAALAG